VLLIGVRKLVHQRFYRSTARVLGGNVDSVHCANLLKNLYVDSSKDKARIEQIWVARKISKGARRHLKKA
jgi:hypothetical protein